MARPVGAGLENVGHQRRASLRPLRQIEITAAGVGELAAPRVLLDDMGRRSEALDAYRAALREDPRFADCHYNLGLLCKRLGKPRDAIQHLAAYRRLTATTRPE